MEMGEQERGNHNTSSQPASHFDQCNSGPVSPGGQEAPGAHSRASRRRTPRRAIATYHVCDRLTEAAQFEDVHEPALVREITRRSAAATAPGTIELGAPLPACPT